MKLQPSMGLNINYEEIIIKQPGVKNAY